MIICLKSSSSIILPASFKGKIIFSLTVLVYGGINITSLTMKQISAALGVSMGYVYMVLPLSGVLMIFYGVNNILNIIKEKNNVETKQIKKFS